MTQFDIISLYNERYSEHEQNEDNYIEFMQGLLLDNLITLNQYLELTEEE